MANYIVSAPRSGLNWTRYCIEHFYGLPTPGKALIVANADPAQHAFQRSHDALLAGARKTEGPAYRRLDPAAMAGERLALILRDPLETFVRASRKSYTHFAGYAGNIRFFDAATAADKLVVHYEDLVADPGAMWRLMAFFDLAPQGARELPTETDIAAEWEAVGKASRSAYQRRQFWSGGAKTRKNPTDFEFHQRSLPDAEKAEVWRWLEAELSAANLAHIARYRPRAS